MRFSGPTADLLGRDDVLRSVFLAGAAARAPVQVAHVERARHRRCSTDRRSSAHGLSVALRRRRTPCRASTCRCSPARSSASSAPTAPARRRCSTCSAATSSRPAGRVRARRPRRHRLVAGPAGDGRASAAASRTPASSGRSPSRRTSRSRSSGTWSRAATSRPGVFLPDARRDRGRRRLHASRTCVELLGLGAYRDKQVRELSTGSRRIVDLGMALAHDPSRAAARRAVVRHRAARDRGARPAAAQAARRHRLRAAGHRARHAAAVRRCPTGWSRSSSARVIAEGTPDDVLQRRARRARPTSAATRPPSQRSGAATATRWRHGGYGEGAGRMSADAALCATAPCSLRAAHLALAQTGEPVDRLLDAHQARDCRSGAAADAGARGRLHVAGGRPDRLGVSALCAPSSPPDMLARPRCTLTIADAVGRRAVDGLRGHRRLGAGAGRPARGRAARRTAPRPRRATSRTASCSSPSTPRARRARSTSPAAPGTGVGLLARPAAADGARASRSEPVATTSARCPIRSTGFGTDVRRAPAARRVGRRAGACRRRDLGSVAAPPAAGRRAADAARQQSGGGDRARARQRGARRRWLLRSRPTRRARPATRDASRCSAVVAARPAGRPADAAARASRPSRRARSAAPCGAARTRARADRAGARRRPLPPARGRSAGAAATAPRRRRI